MTRLYNETINVSLINRPLESPLEAVIFRTIDTKAPISLQPRMEHNTSFVHSSRPFNR